MNINPQLVAAWKREEQAPFSGWDFSHLQGRMIEESPPWSYPARAAVLLAAARRALDMGTGGGERLLSLRQAWPPLMVATEDYPPNVVLAGAALAAAGGHTVAAPMSELHGLPFADASFDVVLNRHSGINPAEVGRVLAPGGTFFTRQVHGLWAVDLLAHFGAKPEWPDSTPEYTVPALEAAGLTVVTVEEWNGSLRFTDVGAVVYYLKAVPWLVPDFSVNTHLAPLLALQARLDRGEELAFAARLYLLEAVKPK